MTMPLAGAIAAPGDHDSGTPKALDALIKEREGTQSAAGDQTNDTDGNVAADGPAVPEVNWSGCEVVFQCGTASVPLDHDKPNGKRIDLALRKLSAAKPDQRIGTLFISPGGTGPVASNPVFFAGLANGLGPQVRDRFDLVAFDVRGSGQSTPLLCKPAPDVQPVEPIAGPYPSDPEQIEQYLARDEYMRNSCAATGGEILHHISTADVARDMDLLRQAFGDDKLSYYGASQGANLGVTYATLFPDRVRAVAVDAVMHPNDYIGNEGAAKPMSDRVKLGDASFESLTSALQLCDTVSVQQCALTGNAMERWQRVRDSLDKQPLELPGFTVDRALFDNLTTVALTGYRLGGVPLDAFPAFATLTKALDLLRFGTDNPDGRSPQELRDQVSKLTTQLQETAEQDPNQDLLAGIGGLRGLWCADSANPSDPRAWIGAAKEAERRAPGFGEVNVWGSSICANWPGSDEDAYHGKIGGKTSTPLLIINSTHDATTRMEGARAAREAFVDSRLVEVETWGHTTFGKSNRCLKPITDAYLLGQKLPAEDVKCKPDQGLWGLPA